MSKKRKWLRTSLLVVMFAALIFWVMPLGTLFAYTEDTIGDFCNKIEDDNTTVWTNPSGIITGIQIHAGLGSIKSDLITSNGTYGHVIEITGSGGGDWEYEDYYVKDPTVSAPYVWKPGYQVTGIGTPTVNVNLVGEGPYIKGISWVSFFCGEAEEGKFRIEKNIVGGPLA